MNRPIDWLKRWETPPLPSQPTQALPGTPEKIAVMRERVERGEHLHHPQDARRPWKHAEAVAAMMAVVQSAESWECEWEVTGDEYDIVSPN